MKAFRFLGLNDPVGAARVAEVPIPSPGSGEVLVKVGGSGLCASDLKVLHGDSAYDVNPPLTLGHENAGWVAKLGEGVTGWALNEAVVVSCLSGCGHCFNCATGDSSYCVTPSIPGISYDGGLAPYLVARAESLVRLGDFPVAEAAPLADAGVTAYHAVNLCEQTFGGPGALVIIGIGGLGSLAIQIAFARSWSRIIAIDANEDRRDQALSLGATDFVASGPETAYNVLKLIDDAGVRAVIDLVGGDQTLRTAVKVVRRGGRIVQVGTGHGVVLFGRDEIQPGVSMIQSRGGSLEDLAEVVGMASRGDIRVDIERVRLDQTMDAYRRLEEGKLQSRAVVVFDH